MKKLLIIFFIFLLCSCVCAIDMTFDGTKYTCNKIDLTPPVPTPTPPPIPTPTPIPPPIIPNGINLDGPYPVQTLVSIMPENAKYYYLQTTKPSSIVSIKMTTTDWKGDLDIIASNLKQPTCDQMTQRYSTGTNGLWYGPVIGTSNESLGIAGQWPTGTVIFITICNRSSAPAGAKVYWTSY